jgi:RNA polymerase sigma factor (sigma-70 family)
MSAKSLQDADFTQLMSELADGSEEAAWRITELYTPHILRVVRASLPSLIRPKLDSQDFTQAVWASLLLKREYLSGIRTQEQLISLLASAARHKVIDAFRYYTTTQAHDARREVGLDLVRPKLPRGNPERDEKGVTRMDPTPSQLASVRERWRLALESASARDREILKLRIRGGTYQSISGVVGVSVSTVRRALDDLIADLRR